MTASILRHTHPTVHRDRGLVPNNGGGLAYGVDLWTRFRRFLILGTEGGTYYVGEKEHTLDNVQVVKDAIAENPFSALAEIQSISTEGRAPKNDYAIYALAIMASDSSPVVRSIALGALDKVCRTGTHLFQFIEVVDKMRGWGPGLRKAINNWYLSKTPDNLAYQVLKYQNRHNWSHRDVFRKTHPVFTDKQHQGIAKYIAGKDTETVAFDLPAIVGAHRAMYLYDMYDVREAPQLVAQWILNHNVPREIVPTRYLNEKIVQEALAYKMPLTALIRNLGNLSRHGVLEGDVLEGVVGRLTDADYIRKSRVHPISILTAHRTYAPGTGYRGSNSWTAHPQITQALDNAFYKAFDNVAPTGKRFMVGVDVSGSMSMKLYNSGILTAAEVAAALAMVLVRTERDTRVYGFSHQLKPLDLWPDDRLENVLAKTRDANFGSTNPGLLIEEALKRKLHVDVFVAITDNEVNSGRNPATLLRKYRKEINPDAKLIVLATESTGFSIADPNDKGMLDIAGFDSSVPDIIREFSLGNI